MCSLTLSMYVYVKRRVRLVRYLMKFQFFFRPTIDITRNSDAIA